MAVNDHATVSRSCTLSSFLGTDESDDSAQLCALCRLFPDHLLVHTFSLGQVRGGLEHAVLKGQHLLEGVVEERCAEADVVGTGGGEAHFELAWLFLVFGR